MTKSGKMQQVVMRVLAVMLVTEVHPFSWTLFEPF